MHDKLYISISDLVQSQARFMMIDELLFFNQMIIVPIIVQQFLKTSSYI